MGVEKISPAVLVERAEQLLEKNEGNRTFALNNAQYEYGLLIENLGKLNKHKVSKGQKPGSIDDFKKKIENVTLEQYNAIVRQIDTAASNL